MEQTTVVIATKDFDYQGRAIHAGEAVRMRPVDAVIAARRQDVTLDKGARATYQTKVLTAETPTTPQPVQPFASTRHSRVPRTPRRRREPSTT